MLYIKKVSYRCDGPDEYGRWKFDKTLFPNGLRTLSDHLKHNGHKLGIYILPGIRQDSLDCKIKGHDKRLGELVTQKKEGCGFSGTTYLPDQHDEYVQAYYDSMGELFAEWGVHYVKIDGVGPGGGSAYYPNASPDNRACIAMMKKAFEKHDIWMEISWFMDPSYAHEWAQLANGARIYVDIESYSTRTMTTSHRVFQRITQCESWAKSDAVGDGFYVDLDAVLVGMTVNGTCVDGLDNDDVRQTYIAFWSMVSSVFCIGADPRALPEKYLAMLNHKEMLEIHQSGVMAKPIGEGDVWKNRKQVWWKKLKDGRIYVCLMNAQTYPFMLGFSREIGFDLKDIGVEKARLKDVWTGEDLGEVDGHYGLVLRGGQSQTLLVTPC
jgi:hypothetical protein